MAETAPRRGRWDQGARVERWSARAVSGARDIDGHSPLERPPIPTDRGHPATDQVIASDHTTADPDGARCHEETVSRVTFDQHPARRRTACAPGGPPALGRRARRTSRGTSEAFASEPWRLDP